MEDTLEGFRTPLRLGTTVGGIVRIVCIVPFNGFYRGVSSAGVASKPKVKGSVSIHLAVKVPKTKEAAWAAPVPEL